MKNYFAMALLSLLLLPVHAQMSQDPHTMSIYRENDADTPAIDWSAGLKSVQPGELARRENPAPYRSELLEAMVEWARCVDAQDDAAAAAAREDQESRAEKRKNFTTAYKGDPFYETPQGKRRPASSPHP